LKLDEMHRLQWDRWGGILQKTPMWL
jgi:hypothetical protein